MLAENSNDPDRGCSEQRSQRDRPERYEVLQRGEAAIGLGPEAVKPEQVRQQAEPGITNRAIGIDVRLAGCCDRPCLEAGAEKQRDEPVGGRGGNEQQSQSEVREKVSDVAPVLSVAH